jgi:CRISPR system Cascade subunit CasB
MTEKSHSNPFITYLLSLKENRGALAALRRGLSRSPGTAAEMYPYVVPWLPERASQLAETAYYLIAALFAYHPENISSGNMGDHLRATIAAGGNEQATERRFVALLQSHPDDLPVHLRHAVSYLKSKEQPVNWQQLFEDLLRWDHPQRYVQKRWAGSFWQQGIARVETAIQTAE